MKVIVNNQTSLIVEDQEGNILFQWLPASSKNRFIYPYQLHELIEKEGFINLKNLSNEDIDRINELIRDYLKKIQ